MPGGGGWVGCGLDVQRSMCCCQLCPAQAVFPFSCSDARSQFRSHPLHDHITITTLLILHAASSVSHSYRFSRQCLQPALRPCLVFFCDAGRLGRSGSVAGEERWSGLRSGGEVASGWLGRRGGPAGRDLRRVRLAPKLTRSIGVNLWDCTSGWLGCLSCWGGVFRPFPAPNGSVRGMP